jgi:hypothetical protein
VPVVEPPTVALPTVALPTVAPAEAPAEAPAAIVPATGGDCAYIGNANSKKFHRPGCYYVDQMNAENKVCFSSREEAIAAGYVPCKKCNP